MAFDPNVRASDADRDRVASLLREHHAAGRLTAQEFSDRLDRTFAAVTVGELDNLLADLPSIDLYRLPDAALTRQPRQVQRPMARSNRRGRSSGWRAAWASWLAVTLVSFVAWILAGGGYVWPLWVSGILGGLLAGAWVTVTALGGSAQGSIGAGTSHGQLPRADDDLPGRPGR